MEDFYLSQALFRTQEILDNFTTERSMQVKLKALTENGRIEKIKNGLYATVNSLTGDIFASRFEIASALFENACVAYHSALEFHGLGNQMFSEVQVFTEKRYNPFIFNGLEYKFFSYTAKGGIMRLEQNAEIVVTDLERTVVDCIDRIDLAGGLEELVTALNGITHLDEQVLLSYTDLPFLFASSESNCASTLYSKVMVSVWDSPGSRKSVLSNATRSTSDFSISPSM